MTSDGAHGVGDELAEGAVGGVVADGAPVVVARDVEAGDRAAAGAEGVLVVGFDHLAGGLLVAPLFDLAGELVVEDVGEALEEDKGEDEVLELGGVGGAADGAGGVPEPGIEGGDAEMLGGGGSGGRPIWPLDVADAWRLVLRAVATGDAPFGWSTTGRVDRCRLRYAGTRGCRESLHNLGRGVHDHGRGYGRGARSGCTR